MKVNARAQIHGPGCFTGIGTTRPAAATGLYFALLSALLSALLQAPALYGSAAPIVKGPYLQNPTTDSITVCWVSENDTGGTVVAFPWGPPAYAHRHYAVGHDMARSRYHRVRLTGLRPYTRYFYHVICDGQRSGGTFVTAAQPGQPFRFVAYGDTRTQADKHAAVIARILQFRPHFALQTGDLVENGDREDEWDIFFTVVQPLLKDTPYYPALGNHEGNGAPYFRYFAVGRDYSFDYGDAHFAVLDSNRPAAEWRVQEEWLRQDLANHQQIQWRIVALHHTLYTCAVSRVRRRESDRLRARLDPIIRAGRVTLVISGHDHGYEHHLAGGIHYLVTGGGGAPLINIRPDTPFVVAARKAYHDCEINVNSRRINVRAIEPDGSVIEEFAIGDQGSG